MKILLVNDDGYTAEGIKVLEEKLQKYGEVYVVAPHEHMSGTAIGLTIFKSMRLHKYDDHHYSLEGTPADCSAYGLNCLGIKFDLVVSGVNDGLNMTYDILHSGTIGACIEALLYDTPSIAFSHNHNLDFVKDYIQDAFDWVIKNNLLSKDHVVNVNFPFDNEIKGIKLAKVVMRKDYRYFDIDGDIITPKRVMDDYKKYDKESEIYLTKEKIVAVSLLNKDFYSQERFNKYKALINK